MQARRDELKDSFYLYIMRTSIGAGLRSEYAADECLPDRLAELLRELDEPDDQVAREKSDGQPLRKHVRGG
jgi:hypothetical protein